MQNNTTPRYSLTARVLHWLIAGLIVTQFALAKLAERAADQGGELRQLALLANHKSLGLTVLVLVVLRIIWRLTHQPPTSIVSGWQQRASQLTHGVIYLLITAIPLSGWLLASASAYGISWFNLFELPAIAADNALLEDRAVIVHEVLTKILFIVVIVHTLAALAHQFFWRDRVLSRMSSPVLLALFGLTVTLGIFSLSQVSKPTGSTTTSEPQTLQITESLRVVLPVPTDLQIWRIDYQQSYIRFRGEQAGAPFDGEWPAWQADLYFDAASERASFDVTIDVTQPQTSDAERDTTMRDADWFDTKRFPSARFQLSQFNSDGNQFLGSGQLQVKQHIILVPFTFTVDANDHQRTLRGAARLDRLALGLGLGEWTDTTWVGQYVDVDVLVIARVP